MGKWKELDRTDSGASDLSTRPVVRRCFQALPPALASNVEVEVSSRHVIAPACSGCGIKSSLARTSSTPQSFKLFHSFNDRLDARLTEHRAEATIDSLIDKSSSTLLTADFTTTLQHLNIRVCF